MQISWLMLFCEIIILKLVCTDDNTLKEDIQYGMNNANNRVLSRRRRYLTFPEGSSLQLVYDQTIPIVALPLLFTVGVTVAMAWELPSIPLWEITKEIRDQIKSGGLSRIDNNFNATNLIDTPTRKADVAINNANQHSYYYTSQVNATRTAADNGYNNYDKYDYNYKNNKDTANSNHVNSWYEKYPTRNNEINYNSNGYYNNSYSNPYSPSPSWTKDNWKNMINRVSMTLDKKYPLKFHAFKNNKKIYPVFGKRSIFEPAEDERGERIQQLLAEEEMKFHVNHHRSTRNALYTRIEKYLQSKGKNGNACVLRALCETGQKNRSSANEPESFLIEIMKAIFSIPSAAAKDEGKSSSIHSSYEEAHNSRENCTEKYSACKDSIWSTDFLF